MGLNLEASFEQLLRVLLQLPPEEKIRMAEQLRASAVAQQWQSLSSQLPDVPQISMEEIVAEVKAVRKQRHQRAH